MVNNHIKITLCPGIVSLMIGTSCTRKEERWRDEPEPYSELEDNRILSYQISGTKAGSEEQMLYSSIDHREDKDGIRIITVFLPYYYQLLYLEPMVKLPDGAKISPAPDENLVSVLPEDGESPVTYTVTGKSGKKARYTVKVIVQHPELIINELSPNGTDIYTITGKRPSITVKGKNLVPSYDVTRITFRHEDGSLVHDAFKASIYGSRPTQMQWIITEPDRLQKNTPYWVQVESYGLKAKTRYPVYVNID